MEIENIDKLIGQQCIKVKKLIKVKNKPKRTSKNKKAKNKKYPKSSRRNEIMKQLIWICIIIFLNWYNKNTYIPISKNKKYIKGIIIISAIHIITYFYIGFMLGFSKSPYNHTIEIIFKNTIQKIIPIIGIEMARNTLISKNKTKNILTSKKQTRKRKINITIITTILILVEINYNLINNIYQNKEIFFQYICSYIIPIIANNILYTYLSIKTTYLTVIIYRILKEIEILLLPILPDMDWFIQGVYGIISPLIIYLIFKYIIIKEKQDVRKKSDTIKEKISYTITIIVVTTIMCFMIGLFKYEPIAILSNSMQPTFCRGDVVIFKKVEEKQLKKLDKNTIIIYTIGEQNIAHRIVDIIKEKETIKYQTKGDSNNAPDSKLVQINQIKGIYVCNIKYIGFPSVWLYDYFH